MSFNKVAATCRKVAEFFNPFGRCMRQSAVTTGQPNSTRKSMLDSGQSDLGKIQTVRLKSSSSESISSDGTIIPYDVPEAPPLKTPPPLPPRSQNLTSPPPVGWLAPDIDDDINSSDLKSIEGGSTSHLSVEQGSPHSTFSGLVGGPSKEKTPPPLPPREPVVSYIPKLGPLATREETRPAPDINAMYQQLNKDFGVFEPILLHNRQFAIQGETLDHLTALIKDINAAGVKKLTTYQQRRVLEIDEKLKKMPGTKSQSTKGKVTSADTLPEPEGNPLNGSPKASHGSDPFPGLTNNNYNSGRRSFSSDISDSFF